MYTSSYCHFYPSFYLSFKMVFYYNSMVSYIIIQFLLPDFILTYLLTPWCRVFLEKLAGLQLVKKLPAFHGTRRFITALTSVRHLSLSWASPIQSIYPHPTSWRSILILSAHLKQQSTFLNSWIIKDLWLILKQCIFNRVLNCLYEGSANFSASNYPDHHRLLHFIILLTHIFCILTWHLHTSLDFCSFWQKQVIRLSQG